MKKAALAVAIALFSYTMLDIMIWQRIFETHNLSVFASLYHPGWIVMLGSELTVGALLLFPNWRAMLFHTGALLGLGLCGVEDILYYWLDGRPIPYWLPWLDRNPAILLKPVDSTNLLISSAIWVAAFVIAFVLLCWDESRARKRVHGFARPAHVEAREHGPNRDLPAVVEHFKQTHRRQEISSES